MSVVKEISDGNFNSLIINAKATAVVHAYATWSGACKVVRPILDDCAQTYTNISFYILDVDANTSTPLSLGVKAVPTLLFFKDGKECNRTLGVVTKSKITDSLNKI